MLRSLFSAISGLRANQTMLDVTGNNIANANTVGFKASDVVFQDTLSQELAGASSPTAGPPPTGGINPMQVGLGVKVGAITTNFNQGSSESTDIPTNLEIAGDGFFIIKSGATQMYTRAGAFSFDDGWNLVSPDGAIVQGYGVDASGALKNAPGDPLVPISLKSYVANPPGAAAGGSNPMISYNIGADGVITGVYQDGTKAPLFQVAMAGFSNPAGLEKVGDTSYVTSANAKLDPTQIGTPGTGLRGSLVPGSVEASNVDLAKEFTNLIIAQRGFQATSRVITTSDQVLQDLVDLKR